MEEEGGVVGEEWEEELAKELEDMGLEVVGGEEEEDGGETWEQELKQMLDSHSSTENTSSTS